MRLHLVLAPGIAFVGWLSAALALAAPPSGLPGPAASGHPHADGKPGARPFEDHRGPHGERGDEHAGRPLGSAFPAPSGSAFGRIARDRVMGDAGAPRDRRDRARGHRRRLKMRLHHMFRGAVPPGFAEEMKRHARRVARLERVHEVAQQAKDADAAALAEKLLAKENERHERWLNSHSTAAGASSASPASEGSAR